MSTPFSLSDTNDSQTFNIEGKTISSIDMGDAKTKINTVDKFVMVLDCDEVLVNISQKWYDKIKQHPILKQYAKEDDSVIPELREDYYINNWLEIPDEHLNDFLNLYYDDSTFYDDLVPSPLLKSILFSLDFIEGIHILTNCGDNLTKPVTKSKINWLKKHFSSVVSRHETNIDFNLHIIKSSYKGGKGGFLKDNNIKFNSIAEDHLDNIYSVLNTVDYISGYEILIPIYGYNHTLDYTKINENALYKVQGFHNMHNISQNDFVKFMENSKT